jgi:hypothetical protein
MIFIQKNVIKMSSTDTNNETDWKLCYLSYLEKQEALLIPTEQRLSTLERDLKEFVQQNALPSSIKRMSRQEGRPGIAATFYSHGAMYHKSCRSSCNSYRVKRVHDRLKGNAKWQLGQILRNSGLVVTLV